MTCQMYRPGLIRDVVCMLGVSQRIGYTHLAIWHLLYYIAIGQIRSLLHWIQIREMDISAGGHIIWDTLLLYRRALRCQIRQLKTVYHYTMPTRVYKYTVS